MIKYQVNNKISKNDLEQLYSSVGWFAYTNEMTNLTKAIDNSLLVITAWQDEKLVGLIRTVGDGYTILYIQDILVHPDFQNQKIGTTLMTMVLAKYPHIMQKVLLTEDAPNVRHFYEKFGFISCDKGNTVAFYKESEG